MPKFYIGPPQRYQSSIDEEWKSLTTLDESQLILSTFIGIGSAACLALIWKIIFDESLPFGSPTWNEIIISSLILIFGHEVVHLLGFPNCGLNSKTLIGIWLQAGSPYVQYTSPMSRNRFLVMLILPVLILSILPFFFAYNQAGFINQLSWISVLNCIGAGSDLLIFSRIISIVPPKSRVIESEKSLLWKQNIV